MSELDDVRRGLLASCDAFNRKDVDGWLGSTVEESVTFNGAFVPVSAVRSVAEDVLAISKSFSIDNIDGRIVDDTAILFGDYRYDLADGTVNTGKFSSTHVRRDGEWKTLLTHYTPDSSAVED